MKKILKLFSLMFIFISLFTIASCSSEIKGTLEVQTTSTKIQATASFNKNTVLEESSTVVTVKLYNEAVTEQLDRKIVSLGSEKVQGTVSFEDLDTDTTFVLKLYVSHGGTETFIAEAKATTTSSGSSEEKPIEISSVAEFLSIEDDRDAYYKLTANLDFKEEANVSICSSSEPFKGVLDGNGYKISNYNIATGEYAGLFEYVEDATIKNLTLENAAIEISTSCKYVGALAGYVVNSTIEDVNLTSVDIKTSSGPTTTAQFGGLAGVITAEANSNDEKNVSNVKNVNISNANLEFAQVRPTQNYLFYGGGFAGRISGSTTVDYCKVSGAMNVKSRSTTGTAYLGGFAGAIESSQIISNSISSVSISVVRGSNYFGTLCIGGFAGADGAGQINLNNCLAIADIEALNDEARTSETTNIATKAYIGGIVGLVSSSPKGVKNCYYAKANSGIVVKQADANQTTNYVDDCFVSSTIAYVGALIKNKISNVYSYDDSLNVVGMTTLDNQADTESYKTILSDELKSYLENAISLREKMASELAKFNYSSYSYTTAYDYEATITFEEGTNAYVLASTSNLNVENNNLKISKATKEEYSAIRIYLLKDNSALNAIVHITLGA